MKHNYLIWFIVVLLVAMLIPSVMAAEETDAAFSCFTYDTQGQILNGYRSETDGVWYLFVTSTQEVSDVQLYFTGKVTETSKGKLDRNKSVVTGGFEASGDRLILTEEDGTQHTVVVLQSALPSVYVDLTKETLEDIHSNKKQKFEYNSLYIMDPAGRWDLEAEYSVQIKGRGNSTWTLTDKRGYQIKLDKSLSVLGMDASEKWILLANSFDDSMMRSQLVYTMAEKMDMAFVPSFAYLDLWIDGDYLGTYLMGEKVEIAPSRLDLQQPSGALFEHDEGFYMEEEHWFQSEIMHRHYTLKDIKQENDTSVSVAMTYFEAAVDELADYLYTTPSKEVTLESLSKLIDVDSFAKYYLINEYVLNRESFVSSFYWYMDGPEDVLHLGPVWDFDSCMGNDGCDYTQRYGDSHLLFSYLLAVPEFYARTVQLYEKYLPEFAALPENAQAIKKRIEASAEMNYRRWDLLGKPSNKAPDVLFHSSFDEAVAGMQDWLRGRMATFTVPQHLTVITQVSDDCRTMTLRLDDGGTYDNLRFAVRAAEDADQMALWYTAERVDGVWCSTVDLTNFNMSGFYTVHAYTKDEGEIVANGAGYVETAVAPLYPLIARLSDDETLLTLTLQDNTGTLSAVRFEIWGSSAQDTTFKRLEAVREQENCWTAEISTCAFNLKSADGLVIRAYGTDTASEEIRGERLIVVNEPPAHTYSDDVCTGCGHIYGTADTLARTPIYRLHNPNTGERFYTGSTVERDNLIVHGWLDEGIGWYAPIFGGEPVYRLMDPDTFDRQYTMDAAEAAELEKAGWVCESICWNTPTEGVAVYRMYNPSLTVGSHIYTASEAERDGLTAQGWLCEGIGWYGVPDAS